MSPPFYVWHKKSDFPAKILIATWCNHIGISCRIIFISDIECFFMSERVYQLEFTIKYNFRHVYLICCNFIFGGKIRFFMSDVEWRWQVGKSFFFKNQSLFFESLDRKSPSVNTVFWNDMYVTCTWLEYLWSCMVVSQHQNHGIIWFLVFKFWFMPWDSPLKNFVPVYIWGSPPLASF